MKGRSYYSWSDYGKRALWSVAWVGFRWSPRLCHGWRRMLLRCFGATVGAQVQVFPSAMITYPWNLKIGDQSVIAWDVKIYNLGPLEIGERVVISQGAHLCGGSHDYEVTGFTLLKKAIWIDDDAWIAADAFIGPGVRVGRGAVVGARAVAMKDVPAQTVVAGNPARTVKTRHTTRQW